MYHHYHHCGHCAVLGGLAVAAGIFVLAAAKAWAERAARDLFRG